MTILTTRDSLYQILNRYFLHLLDWEFSDDAFEDSRYVLITSPTLPDKIHSPSIPPIQLSGKNDFADSSLDQIYSFMSSRKSDIEALGLDQALWLIIDQQALDSLTCILVEEGLGHDPETGDQIEGGGYQAIRMPCEATYSMFCNLAIGNMGFEDFVDEEAGKGPDGLFSPNDVLSGPSPESIVAKIRDAEKVLKRLGHL